MTLNGIDISNNNGVLDFTKVPCDFVFIKATEGVGWTDPLCDKNYQRAKKAGKLPGVYHFARPDGNSAAAEAKWFASQVKGYIGEAIFVLDLEVNPISPAWAKTFLDTFYSLTKVRALLYMSQSKFNSGDWSKVLKNYGAWVAGYPTTAQVSGYKVPKNTYDIKGDWTYVAWQYTSNGKLPGFSGRLDLDVFYGDKKAWQAYAKGDIAVKEPAPTPTPAPIPQPSPEPKPAPAPDPTPEPTVEREPDETPPTVEPAPEEPETPTPVVEKAASPIYTAIAIIVALIAAFLAAIGLKTN